VSHSVASYLVNSAAAPVTGYPFSLIFKNQKPSADINNALYAIKRSDDGLQIDFDYSDGKVFSRKTFHFTKDSYQSQVSSDVTENGIAVPHLLAWRGGFGDMTVPSPAAQMTIRAHSFACLRSGVKYSQCGMAPK